MSHIVSLVLLLMLISCKQEQIAAYDQLTPAEQEYVRTRSKELCLEQSQSFFDTFVSKSDEQYNVTTNSKFYRGKNWRVDFKKEATITRTSEINVWKLGANVVYFIQTDTDDQGNTTYKFIRVPSLTNQEMIDDLLEKKCSKSLSISISSSTLSLTRTLSEVISSNTVESTISNSVNQVSLAYFLNSTESKTVKTFDSNGKLTKTEKFSATLTSQADAEPVHATYAGYDAAKTQFCEIKVTSGTPNTYSFPYELVCTSSPTAGPGSWTNPSTDL